EHAALAVGPPDAAHGRDVYDVRVLRVDRNAADAARGFQSDVGPRPAAIGRLVDTVAPGVRAQGLAFARPDPDDLRVTGRDRDVADRRHVVVEDGAPCGAVVRRLPHTAAGEAHVHGLAV